MRKTINIRPTTSVYATYSRLSYQPWTAIAEFVDNSTQSFFDHESLLNQKANIGQLSIEINYETDYILYGNMVNHPKYGWQYNVDTYEIKVPSDNESLVMYLRGKKLIQ